MALSAHLAHCAIMADTIQTLTARMEAAVAALDFEEAGRLRDRITLMRGGASAEQAAKSDTAGLIRQVPGAMGLGTSQQAMTPPPGWRPPPKPDLMTRGTKRKR
ncbi:hypothetical protein FHT19_000762 [Novosphingobium sp. SG919]|nr:hypothetical protein [Novosphingobium sp. SG919]